MLVVHSIEDIERLNMKVNPIEFIDNNPDSALSVTPNNVIFLEDIGSYLNSKCETLRAHLLNKDMNLIYNQDMSIKPKFEHLTDRDLIKYYFYCEMDISE